MIRVLVVEDSPSQRALIKALLESDPEIQVVGTAVDGADGWQQALALKPDLITMDIRMPRMDGFEATRRIMQDQPTPIVVFSTSTDTPELKITFNAVKAGALEVIEKPALSPDGSFDRIRKDLIRTVKTMSQVRVIRRLDLHQRFAPVSEDLGQTARRRIRLIAIGASTGGPAALNTILRNLPRHFPLPIIIVQHMAVGFTKGLVEWLQLECPVSIKMAGDHEALHPGQVYVAPDDEHLYFTSRGVMELSSDQPVNHVRPSVSVLFESVARVFGSEAAGVLLTGMGIDGADGLLAMHRQGALTIAQDEATSIVYGMPKAAVDRNSVDKVLPITSIASVLISLAAPLGTGVHC